MNYIPVNYTIISNEVKKEMFEMRKKHGLHNTRFYYIWSNMKKRCFNENRKDFGGYGGRGITVCKQWLEFKNFMDDMHESYLKHVEEYGEKDTTLERFNVNGDYEPENCGWVTKAEQNKNKRDIVRGKRYEIDGEHLTIREISEKTGVNFSTLRARIYKGFSIKEAVDKPNNGRGGDRRSEKFKTGGD